MRAHSAVVALVAASLAATVAGTALAGGPQVKPPATIAKAGKIVYCSDITYPPEEFYRGSTPVGSDIEIATDASKLMGVRAQFVNTGFDGIIAALESKKCDAIISGMNDTAARRKQVAFVDYLRVGQSLMVRKGNPLHVRTLADLSGRSVAVETGTTNRAFLVAESKKLTGSGKKAISVVTFPKDTDAANALKTGKVDVYFGDSPVVAYYIKRDPSSFAFGGQPISPIAVGIAVRRSDAALHTALQEGIHRLYANGTMRMILARWNMTAFALST